MTRNEVFPANSMAPKKERPSAAQITTAIQRPYSFGQKFRKEFVREDLTQVGSYMMWDIVIPAVKSLLSDAFSRGLDHMLFGESGRRSTPGRYSGTPYNAYVSASQPTTRRNGHGVTSNPNRTGPDVSNIIVPSLEDAEAVLAQLHDTLNSYGSVVVGDLYTIVGITPSPIHEKWGWRDLTGARTKRVAEGYLLILPTTISI